MYSGGQLVTKVGTSGLFTNPERQFKNDLDQNSGLSFHIGAGIHVEGINVNQIPETFVTLTDDVVNVIYIATGTSTIARANAGSEPTTDIIPLYAVTVVSGVVTAIVDNRVKAYRRTTS